MPQLIAKQNDSASGQDTFEGEALKTDNLSIADYGFTRAAKGGVSKETLRSALDYIYYCLCISPGPNEKSRLEDMKATYNSKIETAEEDINHLKAQHDKKQEEIQELNGDIQNEKTRSEGRKRKAQSIIFGIISTLLLAFIIIFYSSSSYNAFHGSAHELSIDISKTGNNKSKFVVNAIFNPNTFKLATQNTFTAAVVFGSTILVVAFGILMNMSYSEKKYKKGVAFTSLGLTWDVLLALRISENVHMAKSSFTDPNIQFSISASLRSPEFWIIMIAGFGAYLCFGMSTNIFINNLSLASFIKKKEEEKERITTSIKEIAQQIIQMNHEISKIDRRLSGDIPNPDYAQQKANALLDGWMRFVNACGKEVEKNTEDAFEVVREYMSEIENKYASR